MVAQIKHKSGSDGNLELDPRPIGLPRDPKNPLPYLALALYLELGNESFYRKTGTPTKWSKPKATAEGEFPKLTEDWRNASAKLATQKGCKQTKKAAKAQEKEVQEKQLAMDLYNRYSVSVRGASPKVYGILRKARIEKEFDTLLSVTLPSPAHSDILIQQMQPLEHLKGAYTAWMSNYIIATENEMD